MTTVAFDGKTIAVDTQTSTLGDTSMKEVGFKKGRVVNTVAGKVLLIGVGVVNEFLEAFPVIQAGKNPMLPDDDSTIIIMVKDGQVFVIEASSIGPRGKPPRKVPAKVSPVLWNTAWGSGSSFADTVLRLGGTAAQAVRTAIEIDLYSGGTVMCWKVSDLAKQRVTSKLPRIAKDNDNVKANRS